MSTIASPLRNQKENRPLQNLRHPTAPSVMTVNGHFANIGGKPSKEQYEHGIQIINEDQDFKYEAPRSSNRELTNSISVSSPSLPGYLAFEKVGNAGFNYHLISVFGSQSTISGSIRWDCIKVRTWVCLRWFSKSTWNFF